MPVIGPLGLGVTEFFDLGLYDLVLLSDRVQSQGKAVDHIIYLSRFIFQEVVTAQKNFTGKVALRNSLKGVAEVLQGTAETVAYDQHIDDAQNTNSA